MIYNSVSPFSGTNACLLKELNTGEAEYVRHCGFLSVRHGERGWMRKGGVEKFHFSKLEGLHRAYSFESLLGIRLTRKLVKVQIPSATAIL